MVPATSSAEEAVKTVSRPPWGTGVCVTTTIGRSPLAISDRGPVPEKQASSSTTTSFARKESKDLYSLDSGYARDYK